MPIKKHFISHKERIKNKFSHIKKKIIERHQNAQKDIKKMISHRFFYPTMVSVVAIVTIVTIGTYASDNNIEVTENSDCSTIFANEENVLNQEKVICKKYQETQKKLDNIIPKILKKLEKSYGEKYSEKIDEVLQKIKTFDKKKLTDKKKFTIEYLEFELKKEFHKISTFKKVVITSHNNYGYGYGYTKNIISKGKLSKLLTFNIVNKDKEKVTVPRFVLENSQKSGFVKSNEIENFILKIKYQNKFIKKSYKGIVDEKTNEITFKCDAYLKPNGQYEFIIFGKIDSKTSNDKLKLYFSKNSQFKEDEKTLTQSEILNIKHYNNNLVK